MSVWLIRALLSGCDSGADSLQQQQWRQWRQPQSTLRSKQRCCCFVYKTNKTNDNFLFVHAVLIHWSNIDLLNVEKQSTQSEVVQCTYYVDGKSIARPRSSKIDCCCGRWTWTWTCTLYTQNIRCVLENRRSLLDSEDVEKNFPLEKKERNDYTSFSQSMNNSSLFSNNNSAVIPCPHKMQCGVSVRCTRAIINMSSGRWTDVPYRSDKWKQLAINIGR